MRDGVRAETLAAKEATGKDSKYGGSVCGMDYGRGGNESLLKTRDQRRTLRLL